MSNVTFNPRIIFRSWRIPRSSGSLPFFYGTFNCYAFRFFPPTTYRTWSNISRRLCFVALIVPWISPIRVNTSAFVFSSVRPILYTRLRHHATSNVFRDLFVCFIYVFFTSRGHKTHHSIHIRPRNVSPPQFIHSLFCTYCNLRIPRRPR